jgi:Bacterial SH3 domain
VLVVRSIDRAVHGAVRYVSLGLLLVGVLAVGLRLLRTSEERRDTLTLFADRPVISSLAVLALGMFFVVSFAFTVSPGTLAALSAEIEQQPPEHPCVRLDRQRAHLAAATAIGHAGLIDAVKQRMAAPAQDCLGLASQSAAEEAVERLAARTGIGESSAEGTPPGAQTAARPAPAPVRSGHEAASAATLDRLVATVERLDRTIRQGAGSPAGESAADASSEASPDEGPPKPALRPAAPRERVTTTRVNYRSAPQPDANRLGTLAPGTLVTVLSESSGWTEVRLRGGKKAFVASRFLEPAP